MIAFAPSVSSSDSDFNPGDQGQSHGDILGTRKGVGGWPGSCSSTIELPGNSATLILTRPRAQSESNIAFSRPPRRSQQIGRLILKGLDRDGFTIIRCSTECRTPSRRGVFF